MNPFNRIVLGIAALLATSLVIDGVPPWRGSHAKSRGCGGARPATPVSIAGAARRTTRRMIYATSVYVTTLPVGCTTVMIEGTSLHQCGTAYYQASGSQYVVVTVQ